MMGTILELAKHQIVNTDDMEAGDALEAALERVNVSTDDDFSDYTGLLKRIQVNPMKYENLAKSLKELYPKWEEQCGLRWQQRFLPDGSEVHDWLPVTGK